MGRQQGERRLTTILSADVVGYSRLMSADESGTLAQLKVHRAELVAPKVAEYRGRVVKLMGDGTLMEFGSVLDALGFAVDVQTEMLQRNANVPADKRIVYRVGINIGDIIVEGDDIYGDGVNVAARLEGIAEPGGICVADIVRQSIDGKTELTLHDLGEKALKNISRRVRVWGWHPKDNQAAAGGTAPGVMDQDIRFCTAPDGVQIAYGSVGRGPPLVKAPNWMNHLEYDWQSPVWRHLLHELARDHTLIRFDQRANGLSDWDVEDISLEAFVSDLAAVVDALELERFPLLGISQGCAISVAYAAAHPERVSQLVLYGGFARGRLRRGSKQLKEQAEAMHTLIRHGWGQDNPAFRQMFTSSFVPGATREQMDWFNELQRISVSPENAVRIRQAADAFEISALLRTVNVPTLVLHCRGDALVGFEEGRRMASALPNARFVPLEGDNHLILENEPAWPRFLEEVRRFLADA